MTDRIALIAALGLIAAIPASAFPPGAGSVVPDASVQSIPPDDVAAPIEAVTADWPEKARLLASATIREYGRPDEVRADQLTWTRRHPWTRIAVYRDAQSIENPNNLLQSLPYEVSPRRWRALSAFDRGVAYDPIRKELVARGESEGANLLALNLADDIIEGNRTPAEAAEFYDRTLDLARSGKSSSYMFRLMFSPALREMARRQRGLNEDLQREVQRLNDRN
ncbi:MAG: hypothetical protein ACHQ51_01480 [Elusimicrobiota bacterium]